MLSVRNQGSQHQSGRGTNRYLIVFASDDSRTSNELDLWENNWNEFVSGFEPVTAQSFFTARPALRPSGWRELSCRAPGRDFNSGRSWDYTCHLYEWDILTIVQLTIPQQDGCSLTYNLGEISFHSQKPLHSLGFEPTNFSLASYLIHHRVM